MRCGKSSASCSRAHYGQLIAYGAGWTDRERQRPVRDTGRHEPSPIDVIIDTEFERALADADPLRGIAQLTARWATASVLDPAGVTRTEAPGSERMARMLSDAPRWRRRAASCRVGVHAWRCSRWLDPGDHVDVGADLGHLDLEVIHGSCWVGRVRDYGDIGMRLVDEVQTVDRLVAEVEADSRPVTCTVARSGSCDLVLAGTDRRRSM